MARALLLPLLIMICILARETIGCPSPKPKPKPKPKPRPPEDCEMKYEACDECEMKYEWSACNATCGWGSRSRPVMIHPAKYGGKSCKDKYNTERWKEIREFPPWHRYETYLVEDCNSGECKTPTGLAMQSLESRVCNNWNSGSDDDLKIKFKSTKSKSSCRTEILDRDTGFWESNWGRGYSETWGHNFLGSCAKEFRPSDDLEFRVEITTSKPTVLIKNLEICHLRVTFGTKDQKIRSSIWEWSRTDGPPGEGAWTISWDSGPVRTHWLKMKKMDLA